MSSEPLSQEHSPDKPSYLTPATIAVSYLLIGSLWILFSDRAVETLVREPNLLTDVQTFKGWFYVLVTAGLLYILLRIHFRAVNHYLTNLEYQRKALRESEIRFKVLVEQAPDAVYLTDGNGGILDANPVACRSLGYDREELRTLSINDIDVYYVSPESVRAFRDSLALGQPVILETVHRRKNGETFPVELHIARFQLNGEERMIGFARDVSERKLLERQLSQAQKLEAIGTLAGGVSHDFNNLLQAIIGYTQVLLFDKTVDDHDYPGLMAIQNAGRRAADLVRRLLLFSRKVDSERSPINLEKVIEQARSILERIIPKMVEIEFHGDYLPWTVNADPVQMEQILLNLGTNAADAMPDGGKLFIGTNNIILDEDDTRNQLGAKAGRYVRLTVTDTGHGLDKETMEKIFEPFFTTKEIGKGTGLGLASVYGIVKNHGGFINCDSEVGQGTTFKIFLPATDQAEANNKPTIVSSQPTRGMETILLVDDEDFIRDFASKGLERFGYTVMRAASGEAALELFSSKPDEIDLVIMDIGMPGMGGAMCLQEIIRRSPSAKVLMASGYSNSEQVTQTLSIGASGYIRKPYQLNELLNKVRNILDELK